MHFHDHIATIFKVARFELINANTAAAGEPFGGFGRLAVGIKSFIRGRTFDLERAFFLAGLKRFHLYRQAPGSALYG